MYSKICDIASKLTEQLFVASGIDKPLVGIVLGSGLGSFAQKIERRAELDYSSIEGFASSTVEGHEGRFVGGIVGGVSVVAMQGRVHYYEGYEMSAVTLGVRVMAQMGIKVLIVTNAAGGVNSSFDIGDIMLIEDHINLLPNPLIGANVEQMGVRFPDMTEAYSKRLRALALGCASKSAVKLRKGVYVGSTGPTYETPAEYNYFHTIGADSCGMSTTPETIVARHCGVEVLGFSVITNVGRGDKANKVNAHKDVVEASNLAARRLEILVTLAIVEISNLFAHSS